MEEYKNGAISEEALEKIAGGAISEEAFEKIAKKLGLNPKYSETLC